MENVVKNTVHNARLAGSEETNDDNIPPLIESPQEDIRAFAERSELWKSGTNQSAGAGNRP